MKIILFLVLAGLSLAQENSNCPEEPIPKDKDDCLIEALKKLSDTKNALYDLVCKYKGTIDENDENYQNFVRNVTQVMICAGCKADQMIGTGDTLEELLKNKEKLIENAGKILLHLIDKLGLTEAVTKLICHLGGGLLASECSETILKKNIPDVLTGLEKLSCEDDLNALTEDQLIEILVNLGCLVDDTLHTKETVEKILKNAGEALKPLLIKTLNLLKELLRVKGLLGGITCGVIKVVSGGETGTGASGDGGVGGALGGVVG